MRAIELHLAAASAPGYAPTSAAALQLKKDVVQHTLTYAYYWYNFMPLARGTAAVGYLTILGMLLAARVPVTWTIPAGVQADWEAILSQTPAGFIKAVAYWICPEVAELLGSTKPVGCPESVAVDIDLAAFEGLADVETTLATLRARLLVLSKSFTDWNSARLS